jgi:glycine/D-amino acid oxidase-like deaminating enzyme
MRGASSPQHAAHQLTPRPRAAVRDFQGKQRRPLVPEIAEGRYNRRTPEPAIRNAPNKPASPVHWGTPPWRVNFRPALNPLPKSVDVAIIGGGFTGLAAAAWLRRLDPKLSVAVFEAGRIGHGASGRTGGMVLGETAAGAKPGLGDVLAGFPKILRALQVACDLSLGGAWEIARKHGHANSPINWEDSGTLRVVKKVPGGSLDPGKMVSDLARAAVRAGAMIFENRRAGKIEWRSPAVIEFARSKVRAAKILLATNALSLDLAGYEEDQATPRLTLAALTPPVTEKTLAAIGLGERKPFYTVDFPYLWGRVRRDRSIVWGAGLVAAPGSRDLETLDIRAQEPQQAFATLENRVRHLHPALERTRFTHAWGGPILFRENWTPVFTRHPASRNGIVLGAYAGHGVALSVYLGTWAAEALLGKRDLPRWGSLKNF